MADAAKTCRGATAHILRGLEVSGQKYRRGVDAVLYPIPATEAKCVVRAALRDPGKPRALLESAELACAR